VFPGPKTVNFRPETPSAIVVTHGPSGPAPGAGEVTRLLQAWRSGDEGALESLMPLIYGRLREMARRHLARERRGHTLQPTAIVHEAYLRLSREEAKNWQSRSHFFAVAGTAMRRILVDYARRRSSKKRRGGSAYQLESGIAEPKAVDLIAVDDALQKLALLDPERARVVELRFFAGLTEEETAAALEISTATARRRWIGARTWLHRELAGHQP
jgi:RNA polymerase sigma factor (TIGR02999 family)